MPPFIALALATTVLMPPGLFAEAPQQDAAGPAQSRTDADQIEAGNRASSAFLTGDDSIRSSRPPQDRAATASAQLTSGSANPAAAQISSRTNSTQRMSQLSKAELDFTLAQLSPTERKVLFEAISGTDICDNPPAVAAIRTLCSTRLETRSGEFAFVAPPLSSEERLLQGGFDNGTNPTVERVIERLARNVGETGDFNNQAIASVVLGGANASAPPPRKPDENETSGLLGQTQEMINAIVERFGGTAPGPP